MAKFNFGDVAKSYIFASFVATGTGLGIASFVDSLNGAYSVNYKGYAFGAWCLLNTPVAIAAMEATVQKLGLKKPDVISAVGADTGREVTINYQSGPVKTFFSQIGGKKREPLPTIPTSRIPPAPDIFLVSITLPGSDDQVRIELSDTTVQTFLDVAWYRQQSNKPPFSRNYWTKNRRPRWSKDIYYGSLRLLLAHKLIVNRRAGKSGRLSLQPKTAMRHLKYSYGLQPDKVLTYRH